MNFDTVKQIVEYARSREKECGKRFRFTITTNGLLLDDDKIDFINKEMSNVVLSIDGRKETNDNVRIRVDGSGCYDSILPKFKKLVEQRGDKEYYVRGTFTKYNIDFCEDVFSLYNEGFDQISVEPVVCGSENPYALTEKELSEIFKEYERLAERILENEEKGEKFNFFHFMLDLDQGPCAIKRLRGYIQSLNAVNAGLNFIAAAAVMQITICMPVMFIMLIGFHARLKRKGLNALLCLRQQDLTEIHNNNFNKVCSA